MELDLKHKNTTDLAELSPLLEFAMDELKRDFIRDGGIQPHFGFECENSTDKLEAIPQAHLFFQSNETKDVFGHVLRGFATHLGENGKNPLVLMSASEAWMSPPINEKDIETQERITENGVANEDDKKEIIMFNFESKTQTRLIAFEIIRGEGEDYVVSNQPLMDDVVEKDKSDTIKSKFQIWVNGKVWKNEG